MENLDDLFDKKFAEQAKNLLQNYEVAYNPADWEKLRLKLHKPWYKQPIWQKSLSVAAILAIGVALNTLFFSEPTQTPVTASKQKNVTPQSTPANEQATLQHPTQSPKILADQPTATPAKVHASQTNTKSTEMPPATKTTRGNNPIASLQTTAGRQPEAPTEQQPNNPNATQLQNNTTNTVTELLDTRQLLSLAPQNLIKVSPMKIEAQKTFKPTYRVGLSSAFLTNIGSSNLNLQKIPEVGFCASVQPRKYAKFSWGIGIHHGVFQRADEQRQFMSALDAYDKSLIPSLDSNYYSLNFSTNTKEQTQIVYLNVPIFANYHFWQTPKSMAFLSIGTSIYSFIQENRHQHFSASFQNREPNVSITDDKSQKNQFQTSEKREVVENPSNVLWAGTLNTALGYERRLNQHLAMQVEAFWRIPTNPPYTPQQNLRQHTLGVAVKILTIR